MSEEVERAIEEIMRAEQESNEDAELKMNEMFGVLKLLQRMMQLPMEVATPAIESLLRMTSPNDLRAMIVILSGMVTEEILEKRRLEAVEYARSGELVDAVERINEIMNDEEQER